MSRPYAQIRSKAIEVLRGGHYRGQFAGFLEAVDAAFAREKAQQPGHVTKYGTHDELSVTEKTLFLEVFWDLFREGIITLGTNDSNPGFPWYHVSERGGKLLEAAE